MRRARLEPRRDWNKPAHCGPDPRPKTAWRKRIGSRTGQQNHARQRTKKPEPAARPDSAKGQTATCQTGRNNCGLMFPSEPDRPARPCSFLNAPNARAKRRGGKCKLRSRTHNPRPLERRVGPRNRERKPGLHGFCSWPFLPSGAIGLNDATPGACKQSMEPGPLVWPECVNARPDPVLFSFLTPFFLRPRPKAEIAWRKRILCPPEPAGGVGAPPTGPKNQRERTRPISAPKPDGTREPPGPSTSSGQACAAHGWNPGGLEQTGALRARPKAETAWRKRIGNRTGQPSQARQRTQKP